MSKKITSVHPNKKKAQVPESLTEENPEEPELEQTSAPFKKGLGCERMGLSRNDQKRLILDILKSHQLDHVTRRNELEQLSRLVATLQDHTPSASETEALGALKTYCEQESVNADGACCTSAEDLSSLIQDFQTT